MLLNTRGDSYRTEHTGGGTVAPGGPEARCTAARRPRRTKRRSQRIFSKIPNANCWKLVWAFFFSRSRFAISRQPSTVHVVLCASRPLATKARQHDSIERTLTTATANKPNSADHPMSVVRECALACRQTPPTATNSDYPRHTA
jgi:hypothetical protein